MKMKNEKVNNGCMLAVKGVFGHLTCCHAHIKEIIYCKGTTENKKRCPFWRQKMPIEYDEDTLYDYEMEGDELI